nr:MerR family transcriptional regulator [Sedimentibacter sp.]
MKKYRIGELAKEMGVSHEYIKYYEKNNVIQCERDADSKYRYFSFADAGKVADAKKYRNLGFAVKEVKNFIWDNPLDTSLELFKQKKDDLSEEMFKQNERIKYLDYVLKCFPSGQFIDNQWYIIEQDEFYFFPHTKQDSFFLNENDSIRVQKWIEEQPLTSKTLEIPLGDDAAFMDYEYLYGFMAEKDVADMLKLDTDAPAVMIEKGRCFLYFFEARTTGGNYAYHVPPAVPYLHKPLAVMKQCGLTPRTSSGYCKVIHRARGEGEGLHYYAFYIPVL